MNRTYKIARFTVIVISISCVLSGSAFLILYLTLGLPKASAGLGFMGLSGLVGLAPVIYKKDHGRVVCDERDAEIMRRAALAGFTAAYLVMGLACMLPFFVLGHRGTITVQWLPMIFMGGGLSHYMTHSIAILAEYGKGGGDD
ncbi:MAG: hypothetical protein GY809_28865 [Planctomycetes bacterium]|nr:hypothetical protein [Planctomycetota bacterium]